MTEDQMHALKLAGMVVIVVLVVWLIAEYAGQPGPRPAQGPARGTIPVSTDTDGVQSTSAESTAHG